MPMPTIRHEVQGMLSEVQAKIAAAEAKLAGGKPAEKVKAAGDLAFLKDQKAALDQRIAQIDRRPESSETAYEWLKEEIFNLGLRLQDVVGRL